jgi:transcriptional regulator with XRE-family HTH domain
MNIDCLLVAQELKSLRSKCNKSLEEVSNSIGIHLNTLSKYEKNASDMNLGLLEKLLEYYEVDELIFFKVIREYNHK